MSQLMLPYYSSNSLENQRIRNKTSRNSKKHKIKIIIEKGIYNKLKYCPKCVCWKNLNEFVRNDSHKAKHASYCLSCRTIYNRKYNLPRSSQKQWLSKKLRAFKKIQPENKCVRCGCDDIRFLEINHKNGNRDKQRKHRLYQDIISERVETTDLELLCRPCNHIHYLEMKFKEQIPLKVVYYHELAKIKARKNT